ncbi:hypothetical protein AGLY_004384 [Aphis glycines]|uniref:Uncharacterized protein n=1 Tax=Aphis glycines TaxID=307491 RepID=A0A6G0TXW7_APHGL|nr:hypothetical protein AGLY_004384 [Aphis glycines]
MVMVMYYVSSVSTSKFIFILSAVTDFAHLNKTCAALMECFLAIRFITSSFNNEFLPADPPIEQYACRTILAFLHTLWNSDDSGTILVGSANTPIFLSEPLPLSCNFISVFQVKLRSLEFSGLFASMRPAPGQCIKYKSKLSNDLCTAAVTIFSSPWSLGATKQKNDNQRQVLHLRHLILFFYQKLCTCQLKSEKV